LVWIRVPTVSASANTTIYFYYDELQDGSEYNSPHDVWADYAMVQHMNDATTSTILDSTSNGNDGTKTGANEPIEATGKIGKGQYGDGIDDKITVPAHLNAAAGTVEFWMKPETWVYTDIPWSLAGGYLYFQWDSATQLRFKLYDGAYKVTSLATINSKDWFYVVGTWDSSVIQLFVNGAQVGGDVAAGAITNVAGSVFLVGDVIYPEIYEDEARDSIIKRSPSWIGASYETQRDHFLYASSPVRYTVTDTDTLSGNGIAFLAFCAAIATLGVVLLMNKKMKRR